MRRRQQEDRRERCARSPFAGGVLGFSFEYPTGGGALALSAGGSATVQGVFASCIYTSKKVFNFGLMFDATPDITVAATGDSTGQDSACVGLKWMCGSALAGITSLGVKTTTAALSLVAVKCRQGRDARGLGLVEVRAPGAPASRRPAHDRVSAFSPLPTVPPPRGLTCAN